MVLMISAMVLCPIFILVGVLIRKYPQYISGFDKANPPNESTLKQVSIALIATGFLTVFGVTGSFILFDSDALMGFFLISPAILVSIFSVAKFKGKYWKISVSLLVFFLFAFYVFGAYALAEPSVKVDDQQVHISGCMASPSR